MDVCEHPGNREDEQRHVIEGTSCARRLWPPHRGRVLIMETKAVMAETGRRSPSEALCRARASPAVRRYSSRRKIPDQPPA